MTKPRIVLPGGSGFLGRVLAPYFVNKGYEVIVLSRQPAPIGEGIQTLPWDGCTHGPWAEALEGATAVINLAGRSVNCRYHARNRKLMMDSRVDSTRVLGEAIARCKTPPGVWMNSSTATIYKHSFDKPMDESSLTGATPEAKDAFSIEVATAWERTFEAASTPHTRKVLLRTAMVLDAMPGTVFRVLRNLAKRGLGGKMGTGKQYMSWIHSEDFCRALEFILHREELCGVVNIAAPNPLPNREVMRLFREIAGMPFGLPAAEWMLELGAFFLRTETELIIKSRRVVPKRLLDAGFKFHHPELPEALRQIESNLRKRT
ncbi:MAG: TIGR01777 family oxidoreductase [Limisphaerales bacterium]